MKRLLVALAALATLATPALAANVTVVGNDSVTPIGGALTAAGYSQMTSISSASTLTVPSGATVAVVTVESQAVRYRDDGTAPTATVGMPVAVGQTVTVYGSTNLAKIQFIEQTASAKLNVDFYK